MPASDRESLLGLMRAALLRGDFTLSSGKRSSVYLDARLVTLSASGSFLVGRLVLLEALRLRADAVAGLTLGADPIVAAAAVAAGLQGEHVDGLIVRKQAKGHGTARRIEGPWRPGVRVLVVDDTLTTGDSALEAARTIRQEGGVVVGICALVDREEGARARIESEGYEFRAVFTMSDLLAGDA